MPLGGPVEWFGLADEAAEELAGIDLSNQEIEDVANEVGLVVGLALGVVHIPIELLREAGEASQMAVALEGTGQDG
jgi:hypothetical protein